MPPVRRSRWDTRARVSSTGSIDASSATLRSATYEPSWNIRPARPRDCFGPLRKEWRPRNDGAVETPLRADLRLPIETDLELPPFGVVLSNRREVVIPSPRLLS